MCSFFSRRFGINDHAALINVMSQKIVKDVWITSIVLQSLIKITKYEVVYIDVVT